MSEGVEAAARSIANGFAKADMVAERAAGNYSKRVYELINNPEQRNAEIFSAAGVEPGLSLSAITQTPVNQRNAVWRANFERIVSASQAQARLEIVSRQLLKTSHSAHGRNQETIAGLSKNERNTLGIGGIGKALFDEEKNGEKSKTA